MNGSIRFKIVQEHFKACGGVEYFTIEGVGKFEAKACSKLYEVKFSGIGLKMEIQEKK
ncbi:hypothetical protein JFN88_09550 [Paenibacillus sp. MAHUQ-46]|uniref:Uncharacterized protein n=1 Tax=Paenibacillus roseus TaxID=2798579 RepID=A0A934J2D9_9BACL|nr:hypothetical protein [Paenibacillus roseus]